MVDTQVPAWLTDKIEATWQRESASESSKIFAEGFSSSYDQAHHDAVNMTHQKSLLDLQEKHLQIQAQTEEIEAQKKDAPVWMQYQVAALKDPATPQPAWQSSKYQTMGHQFVWKQQADEIQKQKIQSTLDAHQLAADTAQDKIDAQKEIAAANNKSRETIANLKKQADDGFTPKTIQYGNSSLVQLGPHRWQYVRGDTVKKMTPLQLQAFANGLSDDDPNKDYLKKAAEVAAVKQTKSTPAATAAPSKAEFNYDPASGDFVPVTQ